MITTKSELVCLLCSRQTYCNMCKPYQPVSRYPNGSIYRKGKFLQPRPSATRSPIHVHRISFSPNKIAWFTAPLPHSTRIGVSSQLQSSICKVHQPLRSIVSTLISLVYSLLFETLYITFCFITPPPIQQHKPRYIHTKWLCATHRCSLGRLNPNKLTSEAPSTDQCRSLRSPPMLVCHHKD